MIINRKILKDIKTDWLAFTIKFQATNSFFFFFGGSLWYLDHLTWKSRDS